MDVRPSRTCYEYTNLGARLISIQYSVGERIISLRQIRVWDRLDIRLHGCAILRKAPGVGDGTRRYGNPALYKRIRRAFFLLSSVAIFYEGGSLSPFWIWRTIYTIRSNFKGFSRDTSLCRSRIRRAVFTDPVAEPVICNSAKRLNNITSKGLKQYFSL